MGFDSKIVIQKETDLGTMFYSGGNSDFNIFSNRIEKAKVFKTEKEAIEKMKFWENSTSEFQRKDFKNCSVESYEYLEY